MNRLVYSTDLSSADADLKILSRQTDLTGQDAIDALANFSADNFTLFSSVETGTDEGETITATDGDDLILALGGDDVVESLAGSDDIATGEGSDIIAFAGDPFEGADVSGEGRQIIGGEDFVRDFAFGTAVTTIIVNEGTTSQAVVDAADAGNIYFNIHSSNFPAGEVRGNLTLVEDNRDDDGVGTVTFSAVLNGESEVQDPPVVTDAEGTGTVTFTIAEDGTVTYTTEIEIENFDISTLTVGHFHEAPAGENGPVVVDILADARADGSIEGSLVDGDLYQFDAGDLGINAPVNFVSLDASADGADIPAGANVIVLLNSDNDGDPDTPFLAGTAAAQIAGLVEEPGPGIFVYWNSNLGVNRVVYSSDLSSADADLKVLSRQTDLTGQDAIDALADFTSENFRFVGDGTAIGTEGDDNLVGTPGDDVIDALGGNDVIDSLEGLDTITTGAGEDVLVFAGDPFEGTDVSADGRQIVGGEDFVTDFEFGQDRYRFNAADFGVTGTVAFLALDANAEGASIAAGTNVVVLLNSDNDGDPDTPFLAGTAAAQIAELTESDGAGFFVYWNSNLGVNRLVYSTNLNDPTADLKILSRQTDLEGMDAIAALADFSADNFEFEGPGLLLGTDGDDLLSASANADVIDALAGDDVIDSLAGSDVITTGKGEDELFFRGDTFEGADVSAEGRQIIGGEDTVTDFSFGVATAFITVNEGTTSQAVVDAADAGNIYFNIHSSNFPAGEVRGNLTLVEDNRDHNGVGTVTFSAILNGENEVQDPAVVTDAEGTGTVTFTIDADGNVTYSTEIEIENFDVSTLTVGHFHEAPAGSNGPVVVDILADARVDGSIEGNNVGGDTFTFDAGDLGVEDVLATQPAGSQTIQPPVVFAAIDANDPEAEIPSGTNVIVLLNSDNDGDAETPFLAGTAATQIAGLVDELGPGLFVYFNSNLGVNRLVYSTDLSDPNADLKVLSRLTDLTGQDAIDALADFNAGHFQLVGDGTPFGTLQDDNLVGTDGDDVIDAQGGNDIIDSLEGLDTITTGTGDDVIVFAGDPFEGADVSGEGRQIVGGEDFVTDFEFTSDAYSFDADDFGVGPDVNFIALDATAEGADIPTGSNVIVLLNSDNDGDADTPFLAGTAAAQIASLVEDPGPGFFVYWNSNLGVNRLVYSTDLSSADADLKIISRQTDLEGMDAIEALANFSADNFVFEGGEGDAMTLTEAGDISLLAVADELAPLQVDEPSSGAVASGEGAGSGGSQTPVTATAAVQPEPAPVGALFNDIDEDDVAAIAQANADAAAGGL